MLFTPRAQSRLLDLGLLQATRLQAEISKLAWPRGSHPARSRACTTFWLTSTCTRITLTLFFKNTKNFIENTQWWNIQQKREQTTLWTLTNEKCGPTTKAKTKKKNEKKTSRREREGGGKRVKISEEREREGEKG